MNVPSRNEIAATLDALQCDIVVAGPTSFAEADTLPEGLCDYDFSYDSDSAEGEHFWEPTELGQKVRALIEAEIDKG